MRFEWREQAMAGLILEADLRKKPGKDKPPAAAKTATTERVYRTNHGGVNHGPPPLTALQRVGLEIEGKGF